MVRQSLEAARIKLSFRVADTQLRVSPALFNHAAEIDRLLDVTGAWA